MNEDIFLLTPEQSAKFRHIFREYTFQNPLTEEERKDACEAIITRRGITPEEVQDILSSPFFSLMQIKDYFFSDNNTFTPTQITNPDTLARLGDYPQDDETDEAADYFRRARKILGYSEEYRHINQIDFTNLRIAEFLLNGDPNRETYEHYFAKTTSALSFPIDKVSGEIWQQGFFKYPEDGRQFATIPDKKTGELKEGGIDFEIRFEALEKAIPTLKTLTEYDRRVHDACATLYEAGNEVISISMIFRSMGNTGSPSTNQIEKITESLDKLRATKITLDNSSEQGKYNKFTYDGYILPFDRVSAYINNKLCESAIHLLREPPLHYFATGRKQITKIPYSVLNSPNSQTEQALAVENYLFTRISHMKNGKSPNKILLSTVYKRIGAETGKQKSDARKKIRNFLDHLQNEKWIVSYALTTEAITIRAENP